MGRSLTARCSLSPTLHPSLTLNSPLKAGIYVRHQKQCRSRRRAYMPIAAADDNEGGVFDPMPAGSRKWRDRPAAIAFPSTLRNPAAWFILCGFLKIVALTMSAGTYPFGGLFDLTVTIPAAIGLMLAASYIDRHKLMQRRFFPWLLLMGGGALLFASSVWYKGQQRDQAATWQAQNQPMVSVAPQTQPERQKRRLLTVSDAEKLGQSWDTPTAEFRQRRRGPPGEGP